MTDPLDELPPLRDVVRRHGIAARKALGQNFLFDLNVTDRIARAAGPLAGVRVVEVGPGPGGLTRSLLRQGAEKVVAIEKDERCLAALGEIAERVPGRLSIVSADALTLATAQLGGTVAETVREPHPLQDPRGAAPALRRGDAGVEEAVVTRPDGVPDAALPDAQLVAPPRCAAREHGDVAAVGVDVQIVGVEMPDPDDHAARSQYGRT